jgi:hypothetical protein
MTVAAVNCNCPPVVPPTNCGPTWEVTALNSAAGTASIKLDNGYRLEINEHSSQIKIINTNCNETTTIWGDPHVDWNGQPGDEGRFFGNTSFVLADGTKITVNTVPWNAAKTEWLAENVVVTKGNQSLVIDGIAQIGKGDVRVYQGLNGQALDKFVDDGKLTVFENANGIGWVTAKGGNQIATQADFNKTIVKAGEANTHDLCKQLETLYKCAPPVVKPPVCPPIGIHPPPVCPPKPPVVHPPVCPPTPPHCPPTKCESWLEALASVWGKKLDQQADKIKDLANQLQNCNPDDKPSVTAQLTAAAQQFQLLSTQSSTMMNALSQGLTTISRNG